MKNIIICTITALALAGCIAQPSAAWDGDAPEGPEAPSGAPEAPAGAPEPTEALAGAPEATEAPAGEEGETEEAEQAEPIITEETEPDPSTEGLICITHDGVEMCRAPDLIDMGLAPLPEVTEGLICIMHDGVELCRAPDLIDAGLDPLPDGTPVTVVTEEQVQELKPVKVKRPGVPKTGY